MPAPRTAKEVKQFLGLIGYYRKFVPRFADISLSRLLDVVPDAQKTKEPDDHEFGSYCFEELEPAKVMEKVSTEVIELKDNSKFPNDLQESRK